MQKRKKIFNSIDFIADYFDEIKHCLNMLDKTKIELAIDMLVTAYKNDRKVFILGNGGSAALASHMACDLGKGTLQRIYDNMERRFRVISLTDNVPVLTAYANDLSFEEIFFQQLRNLVETDDIIIAISGSGNSKNVIRAVKYAKSCGAKTIGFLGFRTGGKLARLVDVGILVDSEQYGPIEDIHSILGHLIPAWLAKIKNIHDGYPRRKSRNKAVPFR